MPKALSTTCPPDTAWRRWAWVAALWCALAPAQAIELARVQMIASYHAGMAWSDAQVAGVREQLQAHNPPLEIQLDFLDTKRVVPNAHYYQLTEALLLAKYGTKPPAVLIAADDDALDFALLLRDKHFKGTPVLFSGVSSSRRAALQQIPSVGGVFDDLDVGESLQQMLRMRPQTQRVVVIHDQSRTSLAQVETLHSRMAAQPGATIEYLTNLPVAAMQQRLGQLSAKDLVFALPFNRDAEGRVLTHEEATDLWTAAANAPVAVTRDVAMRSGVLGGFLVSGFDQGQTVGRLAVQVLDGKAPTPLPFVEGNSHATFDFPQMQRWDVDLDLLPATATVLQRPKDTMESLRPHLPWLSVLFGSMLVIIGLLLHGIRVRHAAEAAQRLSARNYQALFDNSPDAIMVRDTGTGKIVQINPRFGQLFGYQSHEVASLRPGDLSSQEPGYGHAEALVWIEKTRCEGAQFFEWRSRRKDGTVFWSEISTTRFEMAQGQRTVSAIRDITDRKQAEVMAKEFEHSLQQVYQNLPVAVFAIDAQHQITFWNPHMTRLTGVTADTVVGTTDTWRGIYPSPRPCLLDVLVDGAHPADLERYYGQKLRESPIIPGALEGQDYFGNMQSGRGMWIRYCAAPLRDAQGRITGAIQTLIDVTRLKRTQTTLEELNRDLEARVQTRNAELKHAMGQLVQSEKLAALGSLVAGVAHELNTPIGNVMSVATTLTDEVADFSQKLLSGNARRSDVEKTTTRLHEASVLIERNATRAAKLINDFKEVAVDQSSTRRRHFALLDVVNEVLTTTRPLFKNAKHQVSLAIPADLEMDSYPGPLEQALTNFLTNSLNHGFEGVAQGQIHLQAHLEGDEVVLEYADNGCGIAPGNLQHIFEPFYTTKLGRGGSGLGLYIVYNLVNNVLGGSITVHSNLGEGTRFVLRLPAHAPAHSGPAPLH
ncbi:MAG: PAS domain S-box protein [Burkholderiaceae bacterium]|nr:PAS domain S-box protein [Burkholderiaceae bacterium]